MKLRTQIVSLGVTGAIFSILIGSISLFCLTKLGASLDNAILAAESLRASQHADMMHDAVRGDAQLALLGAMEKNAEEQAEAEKGHEEHAQTFEAALTKLEKMPLSKHSVEALQVVRPLVRSYIDIGERVIKASKDDVAEAQKLLPSFQVIFNDLETKMEELSNSIEKDNVTLDQLAQANVRQTALIIAVTVAFALVLMISVSFFLARRMTLPIGYAVSAADQLAQGDLSHDIHVSGDDETKQLLQSLATMQSSFLGIVREVKDKADKVSDSSSQIAQGNVDLSSRTEQQAGALEETASSMEHLSAAVTQNADNAKQANELALSASTVASKGGEVVSQVVITMKEINDSSKKIADIISVIDGIAFQTNILALNAAVEAARAGEQGRGFAVVASEVRSLAGRSAEAAKEIKSLIAASVDSVNNGTTLVDQAGTTMSEVVASIGRLTDIMGKISNASAEQSVGVAQVGQVIVQLDNATQQNTELVEKSAKAAESLKEQARHLVDAVAAFKISAFRKA